MIVSLFKMILHLKLMIFKVMLVKRHEILWDAVAGEMVQDVCDPFVVAGLILNLFSKFSEENSRRFHADVKVEEEGG